MKQFKFVVMSMCSILLLWALSTGPAAAQTITEIIDGTGDGSGNLLIRPFGIAVDGSGNVFVAGSLSDNAFKIAPDGVITEIIDATGDGAGNPARRGSWYPRGRLRQRLRTRVR